MITEPRVLEYRNLNSETAIIFIHGFSGDIHKTWGQFIDLLKSDHRIADWDIYSLGYATRLRIDLVGFWSADPPIETLADLLRTSCKNHPLNRYKSLAFVAHSMGGLVIQRAIVDDEQFRERVGHVFLFGTPSAGILKATILSRLKRQIRDMGEGSNFIKDLRQRWTALFSNRLPFFFNSVAGDQDEFVPRGSTLTPFLKENQAVVPGNHLQIVKPTMIENLGVQLVLKGLIGNAASGGQWNSARVAVENRKFEQAIRALEPHADELDDSALVQLALAFDSIGQRQKAIAVLERRGQISMDAMGTLAGRLKRRWLVERRKVDAEKALQLYTQAFHMAEDAGDFHQAMYHGINMAFMYLAFQRNHVQAKEMAENVITYCQKVPADKWRLATEGEAYLILGKFDLAFQKYAEAVQTEATPRELDSMYQQAGLILGFVGNQERAAQLEEIFRSDQTRRNNE